MSAAVLMGFRKVIVTVFIVAVAAVLAAFRLLTAEFSQVAVTALIGFSAANAVERHSAKAP